MKLPIRAIAIALPFLTALLWTGAVVSADGGGRAAIAYGRQTSPIVDGDGQPIIYGADGVRFVGSAPGVSVVDHLASTRLEINPSNIDRHEYGPFGETDAGESSVVGYTGKEFDPYAGVYDFIARQYDPSLGRFLGRDPKSASSEPYSYTKNNPINYTDPDGRQPVHFFLYSTYGTIVPDRTGTTSMRADTLPLIESIRSSPVPILTAPLEINQQAILPINMEMEHLTLRIHGVPGGVDIADGGHGMQRLGGHGFAEYLHSRIRYLFGVDGDRGPTSINFISCANSCRTRSLLGGPGSNEDSFADVFARSAPDYFPRLRHVTGSPYDVGVAPLRGDINNLIVYDAFVDREPNNRAWIRYTIDRDLFFRGGYDPRMLRTPNLRTLDDPTIYRAGWRAPGPVPSFTETQNPENLRHFLHNYRDEFSEPIMRRIPVLPPAAPMEE